MSAGGARGAKAEDPNPKNLRLQGLGCRAMVRAAVGAQVSPPC